MNTMTITQGTLEEFRMHLHTDEKSQYTIRKYVHDARSFRLFVNIRPLTKDLVLDYKNYLFKSGKYTDGSINSILASLRGLFKFMGRDDCNVAGIRTQEMPYCPEDKSLTMEEYQRLLNATKKGSRLEMILKVLAGTGIRISELVYFTVEALHAKGQHVTIRVFCKNKSREIIIPDNLRKELLAYIEEQGIKEGVIFRTRNGKPVDRSNLWKQMKDLCKKAEVDEDKVFPHNFRKLFARMFYEVTCDIAQLACLLGHSSVNTTMIYIKRTEREVRAKVDKIMSKILFRVGDLGKENIEKKDLKAEYEMETKCKKQGCGK